MANVNEPTQIYPVATDDYDIQLGIFKVANLSSGANTYYHMKTNVSTSGSDLIMIEAVGYNYGTGAPIRCAWYASGGSYRSNETTAYNGITANAPYNSSDNYVVLVAYATSLEYCGFTLNAYNVSPTSYRTQLVSISASVQTSTSTGYY